MHLATECKLLFKDDSMHSELCKQVDGIGVGSPFGCTRPMINFFLGHFETLILKEQLPCHR